MPGIEGVTITADALHCQRETCDLIVQEGGGYCLQLKGNQGDMKADVRAFIDDQETDYIDEYTSTDADHGRVETRCTAPKHLDDTHRWPSLKAFVHAISTRELNGYHIWPPLSLKLSNRDSDFHNIFNTLVEFDE